MLNKIKLGYGKVLAMLMFAVVAVQNTFAAAKITLPATAETDLSDIITDNFGVVIGVVILAVGATLLIKLIRKSGNA